MRQTAPLTPAIHEGREVEVSLSLTGPVARLRSIELFDSAGKPVSASGIGFGETRPDRTESINPTFRLSTAPTGPVMLRIRHYESEETVRVPFDITMSIGL